MNDTFPMTVTAAHKKSTARHRRGPRTGGGRSTSERIIDAAERLFAKRGFHGVSVRDITAAAGVDVALVAYHFGSKFKLLESVLQRRAEILNDERRELLRAVIARSAPGAPDLEAIIDAFTHPLLNRSARGGAGWKSYFALIAHVNNSPEFGGLLMTRSFDPVVDDFIAALRLALPDCDDRDIYWSYHFLSGALTLTFAETGRIDNLSHGLCLSTDLDAVHARLVPYVAAGFRSLCAARIGPSASSRAPAARLAKRKLVSRTK